MCRFKELCDEIDKALMLNEEIKKAVKQQANRAVIKPRFILRFKKSNK